MPSIKSGKTTATISKNQAKSLPKPFKRKRPVRGLSARLWMKRCSKKRMSNSPRGLIPKKAVFLKLQNFRKPISFLSFCVIGNVRKTHGHLRWLKKHFKGWRAEECTIKWAEGFTAIQQMKIGMCRILKKCFTIKPYWRELI